MNPILKDVQSAFAQVNPQGTSITIDRSGIVLPGGGHLQGIQRKPGQPQVLVLTSSSDKEAFFLACAMTANGLTGVASQPMQMEMKPFAHAGGCQFFGDFLVAGVEDHDANRQSQVQFWDFVGVPMQRKPMTLHRQGLEYRTTAGAAGMSTLNRGGGTALAVATYNADSVDFYMSEANPFGGSPFNSLFTWTASEANKKGWIDSNWGQYQNVNLLTDPTGLFMVAFHNDGKDWMDLYRVNLVGDIRNALVKVGKKHMFCHNGCSFQDGAGIFIPSEDGFEVFAVNGDFGDPKTGKTIHANHFSM
jgi:hypothetical protein